MSSCTGCVIVIKISGEVFLVGRVRDPDEPNLGWDYTATCTTWENALKHCQDALDFIARVPLDPEPGDLDALDSFFPHAEEDE